MSTVKRNQIIILAAVLAAGLLWWFAHEDPRVAALNEAIQQDAALRAYPYRFHVVRVEDGTAVMATPRSPKVPAFQALKLIHPSLQGRSPESPDFMQAQQELADLQSRAREIVLQQPGIRAVKWELDKDWLASYGILVD